jgi:hypothetical protein
MSQQQIHRISAKSYLDKANSTMTKQADLHYLEDTFMLETKYSKEKFLHSYLYKYILCTEDCYILDLLEAKTKGICKD